jgi:hypothetical protein
MGLPEILISFTTAGLTAIERSERGIVCLIVDEATPAGAHMYTDILGDSSEIVAAYYTAANQAYIKMAFEGRPVRVIVVRKQIAAPLSVVAEADDETFTASAHGYQNGVVGQFTAAELPTGITAETDYYIVNRAENTFQVSLTKGGSVVEFSTDGTTVVFNPNVLTMANCLAVAKPLKFNYLCAPFADNTDTGTIVSWITARRNTDYMTVKAVVSAASAPDHEGVIDFQTDQVVTKDNNYANAATYTKQQFCPRIAGILAGLSLSRSCTYLVISEVTDAVASTDPATDINAGKLILVFDGESWKIARGVNSATTFTATYGEDNRKIKIVEGKDLIRDDIRSTFETSYVGKIINDYDNKMNFIAAINVYFEGLTRTSVLDKRYANLAAISLTLHRALMIVDGEDPSEYTDQEIKEYNTGSKVLLEASVRLVDAMEDLTLEISM